MAAKFSKRSAVIVSSHLIKGMPGNLIVLSVVICDHQFDWVFKAKLKRTYSRGLP